MIRPCTLDDFESICAIINGAALAYSDVIPDNCWSIPYMSETELTSEISNGVAFFGFQLDWRLIGVLGVQHVKDVTLIRHAYVETEAQRQGVGSELLKHVCLGITSPVLIGTWSAASWAIAFYYKHGFTKVPKEQKTNLLKCYWRVSQRQSEASEVLANRAWFKQT